MCFGGRRTDMRDEDEGAAEEVSGATVNCMKPMSDQASSCALHRTRKLTRMYLSLVEPPQRG